MASFVALLAGAAALPGGFPAQAPPEVKISASIHVEIDRFMSECARCGPNGTTIDIPSCNFVAVVQFPNYTGAVSYSVTVSDTILGDRSMTGPPFYDDQEGWKTPSGVHWFGLSGGGGGGTCDGVEAEMKARYKVLKATATFDGKARIIGSTTDKDGGAIKNVKIGISGATSASTSTNRFGAYSVKVKKGRHRVQAPKKFCVVGGGKCKNEKSVNVNGTESVNFVGPDKDVELSGHVYERSCGAGRCALDGLAGVSVSATGGGDLASVTTDDKGKWSLDVAAGTWKVTPKFAEREFTPEFSKINATGDRDNIDFSTCTVVPAEARAAQAPGPCGPDAMDWTMPERLSIKDAYSRDLTHHGLPKSSFVAPEKWKPEVFLTQEGARYKCTAAEAKTWKWEVVKKPDGAKVDLPDSGCKIEMRVTKLGNYKLKATGKVPGVGKVTKQGTVYVKDLLIAGMGDSNGSGEGNPAFYFKRCNRSAASYQFQVALWVEEHDPRTSVTFLHTSCSGASIAHLYKANYEGTRNGLATLSPQMQQVFDSLPKQGSRPRKVDAALISAGVNNLGFGALMEFCAKRPEGDGSTPCPDLKVAMVRDDVGGVMEFKATPFSDLTMRTALDKLISELPAKYQNLMDAAREPLESPKFGLGRVPKDRLLLASYPDFSRDNTTASGSCNTTGSSASIARWGEVTWDWIGDGGNRLNAVIRARQGYGYTAPDLPTGVFFNKGYCTGAGWFRAIGEANATDNSTGPFHPLQPAHNYAAAFQRVELCGALYGTADCSGRLKD